jgi:hypothetical protein
MRISNESLTRSIPYLGMRRFPIATVNTVLNNELMIVPTIVKGDTCPSSRKVARASPTRMPLYLSICHSRSCRANKEVWTYPNRPPLIAPLFTLSALAVVVATKSPSTPQLAAHTDAINNPTRMKTPLFCECQMTLRMSEF